MTISNDLNNIRKQSPDQLRSNAYRQRLNEAKIDPKVTDKLLADNELGGKEDIQFLEKRQTSEDVPAEAKTAERGLLSALNDLETDPVDADTATTTPQTWTSDSVFKAPAGDLDAVKKGDLTLKKGDGGPVVGEVQQMLDDAGVPKSKYGVDQRYGPETEQRVRLFQQTHELEPTGVVDKNTITKLEEAVKKENVDTKSSDETPSADGVNNVLQKFDSVAKNGVVSKEDLAKIKGGEALAKNMDSLMFANIDKGPDAWHGLSKKDLQTLQTRMKNGESIEDIAKDARNKSHVGQELAKTNPNFTAKEFSEAVEQNRDRNAVSNAVDKFDSVAKNGFVTKEDIAKLPGGKAIAEKFDALMFSNIDPSNDAWNGLSKKDLQTIQTRLDKGEKLDDIAMQMMKNSHVGKQLAKTKPNFTAEEFSAAVQHDRDRSAVSNAVDKFDSMAKNGFVSKGDIAKMPGGQALAEKFDALIFGSIDPTNAAWNGLSKKDLQTIQTRLAKGESLDAIAKQMMQDSHVGKKLGKNFTYEQFAKAVAQERDARK